MMTKPEYSSALGNALDVRGDVWHWQALRLLATITHSWCYVLYCGSVGKSRAGGLVRASVRKAFIEEQYCT